MTENSSDSNKFRVQRLQHAKACYRRCMDALDGRIEELEAGPIEPTLTEKEEAELIKIAACQELDFVCINSPGTP